MNKKLLKKARKILQELDCPYVLVLAANKAGDFIIDSSMENEYVLPMLRAFLDEADKITPIVVSLDDAESDETKH